MPAMRNPRALHPGRRRFLAAVALAPVVACATARRAGEPEAPARAPTPPPGPGEPKPEAPEALRSIREHRLSPDAEPALHFSARVE